MRDPREHADDRNFIETVLRYIPGFRGYLEKEYRRESDELQRAWLAGRLQESKRGLDDRMRNLTDEGELDALMPLERLRTRLDGLIGRIRSAMQGYSGVFDLVRVDAHVLDRVYAHDAALVDDVDRLAEGIETMNLKTETGDTIVPALLERIDAIEEAWNAREEILKGMA